MEVFTLEKYQYENTKLRKTEATLNSDFWMNADGEIKPLTEMEDDYLRNILNFLYKKRDWYWLNCRDTKLIESFQNGDDFFQHVIRKSTIWTSIINQLQKPKDEFNFTYSLPESI
ncbi:UNVERIFIED_CONTAM: hypothetical protein FO487_02240 [Bacillus amyloliquefaciens DSM 7 = ATCC 23350]|jgi:hypothetical protein|nr:hypothetical protein [Bacillus amyloliquefaciens]QAV93187.1 hypothetical protein ES966_13870 [Bacillus velezensis]QAW50867.1 hypothetical protein ETK69_14525 [Bacillus velezensis]QKN93390.1 hypothetical protein HTY60_16480 [Bacillus amyloliquefaciens]QMT24088.1 hypothetical protein H2N97_16430 [Bacillus velezensis]